MFRLIAVGVFAVVLGVVMYATDERPEEEPVPPPAPKPGDEASPPETKPADGGVYPKPAGKLDASGLYTDANGHVWTIGQDASDGWWQASTDAYGGAALKRATVGEIVPSIDALVASAPKPELKAEFVSTDSAPVAPLSAEPAYSLSPTESGYAAKV